MTKTRHLALLLPLLLFAACGKHQSEPPEDQVLNQIKAALPGFLEIRNLDTELVSSSSGSVVKFKASVRAREDLFIRLRSEGDEPPITLLTQTSSAGQDTTIYGSVSATHAVDKWNLAKPHFDVDGTNLGNPRGAFGPMAFAEGSKEATEALQAQARRKQEAELAARQAEEKRQRDADAAAQALLAKEKTHRQERVQANDQILKAYAVGTKWTGTWRSDNYAFPITAEILQSSDEGFEIKFADPKNPGEFRVYGGAILRDDEKGGVRATGQWIPEQGKYARSALFPISLTGTAFTLKCTLDAGFCDFLGRGTVELKPAK